MEQHYLINAYNLLFRGASKREFYFLEASSLHQAFQERVQEAQPGLKAIIGRPGTSLSAEVKDLARAHIFMREVLGDQRTVMICGWDDETRVERREPPPGWRPTAVAPIADSAAGFARPAPVARLAPLSRPALPQASAARVVRSAPQRTEPRPEPRFTKSVIPAGSSVDPQPVLWRPPIAEQTPSAPTRPRRMMLGRYLHAQGLITLEQLIDALRWQRAQRPMVGVIAMRWGFINLDQLCSILRSKGPEEFFCEVGVRLGYLTELQRLAVLGRQRKMQKPLGSYFVEQGILTSDELERYAQAARTAVAAR